MKTNEEKPLFHSKSQCTCKLSIILSYCSPVLKKDLTDIEYAENVTDRGKKNIELLPFNDQLID